MSQRLLYFNNKAFIRNFIDSPHKEGNKILWCNMAPYSANCISFQYIFCVFWSSCSNVISILNDNEKPNLFLHFIKRWMKQRCANGFSLPMVRKWPSYPIIIIDTSRNIHGTTYNWSTTIIRKRGKANSFMCWKCCTQNDLQPKTTLHRPHV